MEEIRLHGRGGQGAAMAAEMLAVALAAEGKRVAAFPMFGFERRGAPVVSFVRFNDRPIREKTKVYSPNCVIILDPVQINTRATFEGMKTNGILVVNIGKLLRERPHPNVRLVGTVDATSIALEELGIAATNTCMMGAFAATTSWVSLESILLALERYFRGEPLRKNIRSAERGFRETKVVEW